MALGMAPAQAYGGTRIQETNQSKDGQCTGTIIDPTGEPVIGATVTVKGKQGGTITDFDGKFALSDVNRCNYLYQLHWLRTSGDGMEGR